MPHFDEDSWSSIVASEDTELGLPATDNAIAEFQAKHGFVLPEAHREFLLRANGGVVGFVRLFGVGRNDSLELGHQITLMRAYIEKMAEGPILPFASDWGGSYFCYDLQKPVTAKGYPVLYWHHEYSEEPSDRPMLWSIYAPDFVCFIKNVIEA
jgi:hypothetical protein